MLDPHVEGRPWDEQLALDDEAYRVQLAYLLERSRFYREKLGLRSADDAGGLAEIAALPLTEKPELKATATTRPVWPLSVANVAAVWESHSRAVPSSLAVTSRVPSGLNATAAR